MRMIPRFSALLLAASCLTAFGQSEYCLDGTVWDEALQGCVVDGQVDGCSLVYDGNNDGLVGSFDLIGFLTEFGAECSPEPTFSCGSPINYQGYDYETVQIGEQCWFAENLRAENYRNGDDIPADLSDNEWTSTNVGAVTVYGETLVVKISHQTSTLAMHHRLWRNTGVCTIFMLWMTLGAYVPVAGMFLRTESGP